MNPCSIINVLIVRVKPGFKPAVINVHFGEVKPGFKGLNQGSTFNLGLTLKPRFKVLNPDSTLTKCTFISSRGLIKGANKCAFRPR